MLQRSPNEFERKIAIIVHTTINRNIEAAFPTISSEDRDALFVGIIDRLARMRGWTIRHWYSDEEVE